jgi:hypothetical protein
MLLYDEETLKECIKDIKESRGHWNHAKQLDALVTIEDYVELSIVGGGGSVDFRPKLANLGLLESIVNAIESKSVEVQRQALWLLAMMTRSDHVALQVAEHPTLHKALLSLLAEWQHLDDSRTPLLMTLSNTLRARSARGDTLPVRELGEAGAFKHIGDMLNGALLSIFSAHGAGDIRVTSPHSADSTEACPDCGDHHAEQAGAQQLQKLLQELQEHGFGEQDTLQLLTLVHHLSLTEGHGLRLLEATPTGMQCLHHIAVETQDDEPEVSMLAAAAVHTLMEQLLDAEASGKVLIVPDPEPMQQAEADEAKGKSKKKKKKKRKRETKAVEEAEQAVENPPAVEQHGGPVRVCKSQMATARWLNTHMDARDPTGRSVGIPLIMDPEQMLLARTYLTGAVVGFVWGALRGFIGPKTPSVLPMACAVRWAQKAGPVRGAIIAALGTSVMAATLSAANRTALVHRDRHFHEPNDQIQIAAVAAELLLESAVLLLCLRVAPYSFWPAVGTVVWEQDDGGF